MYTEKLSSGSIKYVEHIKDPMTGRPIRVSVALKPSGSKKADKALAEEMIRKKIEKLASSTGASDSITFGDLADRRVAWQDGHDKAGTVIASKMYMSTLKRLIGAGALVKSLTAAYVSDKLSAPAPSTYNERLKHFKSLIRWGYREDLVKDISYLDKLPKAKEPPVREKDKYKYLEHDEINKLIGGMTVDRWRLLTQFLILSGLRIGEAIALDDKDVDLKLRSISVTKTYVQSARQINSTKTETSFRDVYMQDELYDCCRKIKQFMRVDQMKYGYRTNLFLSSIDGGYISYDVYSKYFRENCERLLKRRLQVHSLRHTHTAMLAEAGIPLDVISRRLGHANSKITREVYYHITEKMKEKENEMLKEIKIC